MPTIQYLVATFVHCLDTWLLSTHRFECRFDRWRCADDLSVAESAFAGLLVVFMLLACLANVVWLALALAAEVLLAVAAPDSEFAHVHSGLL